MKKINQMEFSVIYKKYYNMVFYHIFQKIPIREIAEEITSDTFLAAHNHICDYDEHISKLNTWLIIIAKHKVIDYYRSKANNKHSKTTYVDGYTNDEGENVYEFNANVRNPEEELEGKELRTKINGALSELDEKYMVIATMNIIDGMKYEKIADMLNIPLNTVKTRIARAKLLLQEKLKGVI